MICLILLEQLYHRLSDVYITGRHFAPVIVFPIITQIWKIIHGQVT